MGYDLGVALLQPSADYTDRDLASIRTRFLGLIESVFPTWTDLERTNFGNILLDLFAWTGDILSFAQDAQAAEAFIPTAVQRRSLLKLSVLVGYRPRGASAASTVETFTAAGLVANCPIPAGFKVSTLSRPDAISFQTLSAITLTPGAPSASVAIENSVSESESFASTAQPDLSITLGKTPYLDGSLSITTPQGLFTEVTSFVNSEPADKVFVVKVDNNDRAIVQFGDGVTAGVIPTGTIVCSYKTGGGARGNAAAHSIQAVENSIQDVLGNTVTLTCDNTAAATGGADREGAESIRQNAPQSITAPVTSVARTDFEIHAREVPGVDRALCLTQNEDPDVPTNASYMYVVAPGASGPDFPSVVLLDRVRRQFTTDDDTQPYPMMATQALGVFAAPFLDVDITAKIYRNRNTIPATVGAAIRESLATFFATKTTQEDGSVADNLLIDFGYYLSARSSSDGTPGLLAESDILNAIRDTAGVNRVGPNPADLTLAATRRKADLSVTVTQTAGRHDIVVSGSDFPRLGTVTLVDGDTGLPL